MVVVSYFICHFFVFFFKQKTAYEMRISDWSSDVCSSDLRVRSALDLAKEARPVGNLGELQERVAADPDDHQARFELAGGMMAEGDNDGAAEALLEIIRRDREWNDGAARTLLLTLFEVVGLEDPWVSSQRRRLSAILFGCLAFAAPLALPLGVRVAVPALALAPA